MDPTKLRQFEDVVERNTSFVHVTHVNPDADGFGSALAMSRWLTRRGKTSHVALVAPTPRKLSFLPQPGEVVVHGAPDTPTIPADAVWILYDVSTLGRLGALEPVVREARGPRVVFDHHDGEIDFDGLAFNDQSAGATAQLLCDVFEAWGIELDLALAVPLYVGLVSDTGSFNFGKTTPHSHVVAARLLERGVDPLAVHGELEGNKSLRGVHVAGRVMTTLRRDTADPRIALGEIPHDLWLEGGEESLDVIPLVNQTIAIEGCVAGVLFMQIQPEVVRLSFRAKGSTSIIETAKSLGGGGHRNAAGATLKGTIAQLRDDVVTRLRADIANQHGPPRG